MPRACRSGSAIVTSDQLRGSGGRQRRRRQEPLRVVAPASYLDRVEMAEQRLGVLASEPRVELRLIDVSTDRTLPRNVATPGSYRCLFPPDTPPSPREHKPYGFWAGGLRPTISSAHHRPPPLS